MIFLQSFVRVFQGGILGGRGLEKGSLRARVTGCRPGRLVSHYG